MRVADLRAPEMPQDEIEIVKSELAMAKPFEGIDMHRDGTRIPVEVSTGRLVGTPGNLALNITRDISEHKRLRENLERRVTDRMNELATLYEVVEVTSRTGGLKAVLEKILDRVLRVTNSSTCLLCLFNENEEDMELFVHLGASQGTIKQLCSVLSKTKLLNAAYWDSKSIEIADCRKNIQLPDELHAVGVDACISIPFGFREKNYGILHIFKELDGRKMTKEEQSILSAIADQIGITIEISRLRQQLRRVAAREERQKLAQNLHDSVTQSLYSLTYIIESWRRLAKQGREGDLFHWLEILDENIQQITTEMRLLLHELRPSELEKPDLAEAIKKRLETIETRTGITTAFSLENEQVLPEEIEGELYYIAQEALNNVVKHANATRVTVSQLFQDQKVIISVEDNGKGFDIANICHDDCMGIENMKERMKRVGGNLEIISTSGEGTQIRATVNYGVAHE
jgi:signal transduction histidine kinase